jgi:KEOPS complex subunit Cgi121
MNDFELYQKLYTSLNENRYRNLNVLRRILSSIIRVHLYVTLRRGYKIKEYTIKELESYNYLVFSGCVPSEIKIYEIANYLKQINSEFTLIGSQIFDSLYIWGYSHIFSAIWHVEKAVSSNNMISKTFSMELMLYMAGYRQIKKAIDLIGIKPDTRCIIGVLGAENTNPLPKAYQKIQRWLQFSNNPTIIQDFKTKEKNVRELLLKEGYELAKSYSYDEIEKTILQKIALLALES